MPPELDNFRAKYPDYQDMSDMDLARSLARKYPNDYSDVLQKTIAESGNKLMTPQQVEQKGSPTGFAQKPIQSQSQVMETLNAPIDYVGDVAGHAVQNLIDPVKNPTLSDIGGGLTKAAIQYFGPQALSTGARLAAKGAVMLAPGAQGGKMESLIGQTQQRLQGLKTTAEKSQAGFERVVDKIPQNDIAPLTNTTTAVNDLIRSETAHGIKDSAFLNDLKEIKSKIDSAGGAQSLHWIDG